MDYWLGDANLFSAEHSEWATNLFDLPPFLKTSRPFQQMSLYNKPSACSLEAVSTVSSRCNIETWAELLAAVPESRLVLKTRLKVILITTSSETSHAPLGLDPDRVDWLALADGPVEHMQQYANVDIALDPILMVVVLPPVKRCGWVSPPSLCQGLIM